MGGWDLKPVDYDHEVTWNDYEFSAFQSTANAAVLMGSQLGSNWA